MIKIYSFHYNRPDFISLQFNSFKKFLKEEFEFTIVNNGKENDFVKNKEESNKLGLNCIEVANPDHRDAGYSHQRATVYIWEKYVLNNDRNDIIIFLDFDVFLIKQFSVIDFLDQNVLSGLYQSRNHVKYLWPGLLIANLKNLPNPEQVDLRGSCIDGNNVDSGGNLYYYIVNHPDIKIKPMNTGFVSYGIKKEDQVEYSIELDLIPEFARESYKKEYSIQLLCDKCFLHFGRGSNWDHMDKDYLINKTSYLNFLLEGVFNGKQ